MSDRDSEPFDLRAHKTKIVATVGPASSTPALMQAMIRAGLDVARLNFSHGTFDDHARYIEGLRAAAAAVDRDIAIMADLPGPKIRLGKLAGDAAKLAADARFTLTTQEIVGNAERAFVSLSNLPQVVKPGNALFLSDGTIQLVVESVAGNDVICRVTVGGDIRSRTGVNLPGLDLGISAFTERDRECLAFALSHGVDAISQSFVESPDDIESVRAAARALGYDPFVIAKIERSRALEHVTEIIASADGVMIARGDLGVEVPIERIAMIQKRLTREARRLCKPVITATQMLESMTKSRQPTRAEATDVANAVLDGTDCLMLSAESATGQFPVEAVAMLARIAEVTEPHRPRFELWHQMKALPSEVDADAYDLVSVAVQSLMEFGKIAAVVVATSSSRMARSIARFRLPMWIAAVTNSVAVARTLSFCYGVHAVCRSDVVGDWTDFTREWVRTHELAGPFALLVKGRSVEETDDNLAVELVELSAGAAPTTR